MQKRNRENRINDQHNGVKRSFFVKKNGGIRFSWLHRFRYWWLGGKSLTRSIFRVTAAWQGVILIGSILLTCFVMAAFYTQSGEFVVNVDHAGEDKLVLSDTTDFSEKLIVLNGTALPNADNISIYDIDPKVQYVDGDHNGIHYIAYTYYVKNISDDPVTYTYNLSIRRSTKGIDEAVWVMFYAEGMQQIYAKMGKSGEPETQKSMTELPFKDEALIQSLYSFDEAIGMYTLTTQPFYTANSVFLEKREDMQPEEIDKYTVVIWLEGEDPECVDDILGGSIEMSMNLKY